MKNKFENKNIIKLNTKCEKISYEIIISLLSDKINF